MIGMWGIMIYALIKELLSTERFPLLAIENNSHIIISIYSKVIENI